MIKDKNGNIYVLEGPNKLAEGQCSWNMDSLEFYNLKWDDIYFNKNAQPPTKNSLNSTIGQEVRYPAPVKEPLVQPVPVQSAPVQSAPVQPESVQPESAQPAPVQPESAPVQEERETSSNDKDSKWSDYKFPLLKRKVLMHCLPAIIKTGQDNLYGEKWIKVSYGEKFIFPSVVTKNSDLSLEFWTTDPNSKLENKSIIFPFCYEVYNPRTSNYDRVPYDENRWWKISEKVSKDIGWLFIAIPSQDNPDFS